MSDHPNEAKRNLKQIYICNDIYFDVFHWLAPAKVGLALALVSRQFDCVVDTHLKSRKWALGNLEIHSEKIVKMNDDGSAEETLPIPKKPLPNSIVGFAYVEICTSEAIPFLQCIGRLFESTVCLDLDISGESNWNTFATSVWPLLNASAIVKIHIDDPFDLQQLRRLISPSILCDCSNLRKISYDDYDQLLQFPPGDSEESSDDQALCKWLLTPSADGQPKMLRFDLLEDDPFPMDALKATFLSATSSVSFIILLGSITAVRPFELVNSWTREQLTCRQIDAEDFWLIEWSKIDKNAEQWAKWEREAMDDEENDWKTLGIYFA